MKSVSSPANLLQEASQWRLLSQLLSPPTPQRRREVRQLGSELRQPQLAAVACAWCDNATEGAYLHLLGPGGLVPARAVAYRPFADPGGLLAEIKRYHGMFGFHATAEEPPDHIAVLADFVSYLFLKEAYARECEDDDAAAVTSEARQRFIADHLAPSVARMAERLDACGATEWATAAHLLAAKVPPPPPFVPTPAPDEEALRCGGCGSIPDLP